MIVYSKIGAERLATLKKEAAASPSRRTRHMLHVSKDDSVQEMIIVACSNTNIRPHRQKGKRKSYLLIEGELEVLGFDNSGNIIYSQVLTAANNDCLSYDATTWHTIVPLTDFVVFKETISGPYDPKETDWANWAGEGPEAPPEI
jgi:glucose-6-phosphate isomerase